MRVRRVPLIAVAAALTMTLAGCTGDTGGSSEGAQSPLEKVFSQLDGSNLSEEERERQWADQNARTEELVAECMQTEGFEYKPAVMGSVSFGDSGEWEPEKREWVAQYGYGAVNWPGRDDVPESDDQVADPNADYVAGLSESEQTAYYETLYGPPQTDPDAEWSWEDSGCYGWASNEQSEGGDDVWNSAEATAFFEALNTFHEAGQDDPRIDEANAAWSTCMADAGFSGFSTQADAQDAIYDEINDYYESQTDYIENDPALEQIGEREIELALADLDCRASTDYVKRTQAAQFELEEKFLAEHKAEVDALLAVAAKKK